MLGEIECSDLASSLVVQTRSYKVSVLSSLYQWQTKMLSGSPQCFVA